MNTARTIALVALLGASLTACGQDDKPAQAAKPEEATVISSVVGKAITEARREMQTKNITISHDDGKAKAEITPEGDLLLDGKKVAVNAEQRALLMEYRAHVSAIAESGMQIGMQGADLATKAVGEALKGVFSGKSEQEIEKAVEAEAGKIKVSAQQLCKRLPSVMQTQQKLAAALPEFRPYATMTQSDVDDCMDEVKVGNSEFGMEVKPTDAAEAANQAANAATEAADAAKEAADAAKQAADAAKEAADAASH